jgi:hypothetical protein
MKNYIILAIIFVSFITFAYSGLFEGDLLGGTQLNGSGCVCHTTEIDTTVSVWIEGPDTLFKGETGLYRMYLANGPAEAGGHNVAGRFGIMSLVDTFSVWDYRSPNELTQAFPLVFPTPQDTIYWEFAYTAPDSVVIDTLYSCGLSLVYDHIPDYLDRWNYGPKFPIAVIENIIPVEFISFTAATSTNSILLNWKTATETNNMGFQIERRKTKDDKLEEWNLIGFVNGNGTTTVTQTYSFNDENLPSGKYQYRLKQIDFNGMFEYSNVVEVELISPTEFSLSQNYPNPFNPTTTISYELPFTSKVMLKVYNLLGKEVATLVNGTKEAGSHTEQFNASHLASGVYFFKLTANQFSSVRKMLMMK